MEIAGLPFHALILHAAVVFAPLAVLLAIVFAVVPRWRYLTRWPTAVMAGIALVTIWMSRLSGQALVESRPQLAQVIHTHEERGEMLSLLAILFVVVVAVAVWGLGGPSGLTSGNGARASRSAALDKALPVALVLASLLVLVWTFLTGDAGARAVWG
jgi:phosphoglycerol transferase MdoB-like AlkP superfamily enzyme